MNSVWQQLTLMRLPTYRWRGSSYLWRLVGLLSTWRRGSWLLQWGDQIGVALLSLLFIFAPFSLVSNALVGILLIACVGFWVLLTLSEDLASSSSLSDLGASRAPLGLPSSRAQAEGSSGRRLSGTVSSSVEPLRRDPRSNADGSAEPSGGSSEFAELLSSLRSDSGKTGRKLAEVTPGTLTPVHLLVLLYWGIATVATALSPVKTAALIGWGKLTLYLVTFALMARVLRSSRCRSWLITVYLHVALVISVYGIRQWFFGATALATWTDAESSLADVTRVYSYLGNPNLLAGYLLPSVPLSIAAIFAWKGWLPKALALTLTTVNTACLVLTFSRGGWIGLVVSIFVLAVLLLYWWTPNLPPRWRTWAIPILLGSLAGFLFLAILFVEPLRDRVASIFASRADSSNNFRLNVWTAVIEMIGDRPILGIGPGNNAFNKIYPLYQQPGFSALSAYSIFLEIAVETGLIGLGCFLWLLLVLLQQGWTQLQRLRAQTSREIFWLIAAIATLFGMLAHGLVDTVWYRPEVAVLWWFTVALITSYYTPLPSVRKPF